MSVRRHAAWIALLGLVATVARIDPRDDTHSTPGKPFGFYAGLKLYF